MSKFRPARVLVDWHNVQSRIDPKFGSNPRKKIIPLLAQIQDEAARVLSLFGEGRSVRASMRIYNGWHSEREAVPVRLDFEMYRFDKRLARTIGSVSFTAGFEFGNELCCYDDPVPLYDTFRGGGQEKGQKMVDTAITSDFLHLARSYPDMIGLIVSDDDDFLPAILTARAWAYRRRSAALLLRVNERDLKLVTDEETDSSVHYWRRHV